MRLRLPLPCLSLAFVSAAFSPLPGAESSLVAPGATAEKIAGGFGHCEGPAWDAQGFLLFCNPPHDAILKLDAGTITNFRTPAGRATALYFDSAGRLVVNESHGGPEGTRRVTRREKDATWTTLAARFEGKRFNSPNDLSIDSQGRIFFTDPRYSARETMELAHESVYRIDPDGKVARLDLAVTRPNGILVSADDRTLYVADNPASGDKNAALWAFDLDRGGNASRGRIVFGFSSNRGIDGMVLDTAGRIWATAGIGDKAGISVLELDAARAVAKVAAFFPLPETPTNCTFGGARRDILYITTDNAIYQLPTAVTGRATLPGK